jgi:hypothetical protein
MFKYNSWMKNNGPEDFTRHQGKVKKKHCVAEEEITQCFASRTGRYLMDQREDHQTDPPTLWFIAETDYGRLLKIVFISQDNDIIIKTAYAPNETEINIYTRHG